VLTALSATFGTVQSFQSQADRGRYIPQFREVSVQPVFKRSQQTALPSVYWIWGQRVDGIMLNPLDKFYFWYSTSHDAGPGGIALVTAPTPTDPFTNRDKVFTDTSASDQTETPSIIWDGERVLFNMYYQQRLPSAPQATKLATSPDGLNWTIVGTVLGGVNITEYLGSGEMTYFQPFRVNDQWAGYHLIGGGNYAHFGTSHSRDGRTRITDSRKMNSGLEWAEYTGTRRIEWSQSTVFNYKGRLW
jgi:hypothetical protein